MIARMLTIVLVAFLALPGAAVTRPAEASKDSRTSVAAEAKGKKKNKKKQRNTPSTPQFTTVTRTVRQPVTRTFANPASILIPAGAPDTTIGQASTYPSSIAVSGFTNGVITDVNLVITDFTYTSPTDVDILLSADTGRQALVMSDVSTTSFDVTNVDLTLDDEAAAPLPKNGALTDGAFQPRDVVGFVDAFPAPAPALSGDIALKAFDGANPNGTWHLWANDQAVDDVGDIGGWAIEITADVDVQVEEQVEAPPAKDTKDTKDKKKQKKGKGRR